MLIFILILAIFSLLFLALHLIGARHRSIHLVLASLLLIAALALVPFYVNAMAANGGTAALSLPEIIEFYGTVLGLFSSCVLGYVAFRISRNDHKRHNSSCVSINSAQYRPIYVPDRTFNNVHTDPTHRKKRFANLAAASAAFRSADAMPKIDPNYQPQQPSSSQTPSGSFNYNVQQFEDYHSPKEKEKEQENKDKDKKKIVEVGKLSNEIEVLLSKRARRRKARLEKAVARLKARKHIKALTRARLVLAERRLQRYQDYTTLPDALNRNILTLKIENHGPSALQQILITFPRNNYCFTCYVSFPDQTTKYKYIALPDDCQLDDVLQVTFISCYNERTYGEFKLNSIKMDAKTPLNQGNADPALVEQANSRIYYTPKHFHYYGTQKQ